jgi:phosphoribosylanthranilate isomerase
MRTQLKICCIQNENELRLAHAAGARFCGLVSAMPSGPGPIPDERITTLAAAAPDGLTPVLLTARADAEGIAAQVTEARVRAVQIVRTVPVQVRRRLRRRVPGVIILQVVHVVGESSIESAAEAEEGSDYLLLDSGRPGAAIEELGGTGRTHDWSVSELIVRRARVPVFLAGGLGPHNVAEAIERVRPHGVDVCSGLRPQGRLDPDVLSRFLEGMRR